MKLKDFIKILSAYNLEDEIKIQLDPTKSPEEIHFEEEQTANIIRITQGDCGL